MEPAGLAIGVLGLAGIFSSCLEAVDKVQSYRHFGVDSQDLDTQFKAERLRFQQWGQQVGLCQGELSANHHQALNNPDTSATVKELLLIIKRMCKIGDYTPQRPFPADAGSAQDGPLFFAKAQPSNCAPPGSKMRKIAWALRGKGERTEQVMLFGRLVQQLHNLVPPDGATGTDFLALNKMPGSPPDLLMQLTEFRRSIARLEDEMKAETRREIHSWLLGYHSPTETERYEDSVQKRLEGTCDWILNRPTFLNWLSNLARATAQVLWINGPAGFGKTVLCARLVEYLSSTLKTPVAHFFFSTDFESRQDPLVAIRSWTSQITSGHAGAYDLVRQRWEVEQHQVATRAVITRLFQQILRVAPGCTLVVDGLDECTPFNTSMSVSMFIKTINQAVADTMTRVMIVSRDESDIRQSLLSNIAEGLAEYKMSLEDVRADTASYSRYIVDKKLPNKSQDIKADISEKMAERCEGQFLWLRMQEGCLSKGLNKRQLQQAINEEPTGLVRLYERNWQKIIGFGRRRRCRAISLLRWVAFALRPLTINEITEAVLIDDCDDFPIEDLPDSIDEHYIDSEILSLCGSLLEVRSASSELPSGSKTVHVTHFTVKQFLLQIMPVRGEALLANECLNEAREHSLLANMSLRYINFHRVWQEASQEQPNQFGKTFRHYAASSWHIHARYGVSDDTDMVRLAIEFFDTNNPNWTAWREWFDRTNEEMEREELVAETTPPSPLYYALKLDLTGVATCLTEQHPSFATDRSSLGRTALGVACAKGSAVLVETLLEAGADIDAMGKIERAPLHLALCNGHAEVVKLLLDKGADPTVLYENGWTPLNAASSHGYIEVVKLLLENRADLTATSDGYTPLHTAAANGHLEVVKLLLEKGADLGLTATSDGYSPLHTAVADGHAEVVKLLLDKGADPIVLDEDRFTPLHTAAATGHVEIVKLLLEKGADPIVLDENGFTPLHMAATDRHLEIVKLLLDKGADLDLMATRPSGWSPLHMAAADGHPEVVKLLLDKGADLTLASKNGFTPLHMAAADGHAEVVKLLLDKGADLDLMATRPGGWSPLHTAAANGHPEVVKLLLDKGADLDLMAARPSGWSPLHMAAAIGHPEVVKLLLDKGTDTTIMADSGYGRTALFLAARSGRHQVVEMLLATRWFDPTSKDYYGSTPLATAIRNGHMRTVELLLPATDPCLNSEDCFGRTLIWWARQSGNDRVIQLLLQRAQLAGIQIGNGDTMMEYSSVTFDADAAWCDVCTLSLSVDSTYFYCETCNGGDFLICMDCSRIGMSCPYNAHRLVLYDK